MQSFKLIFARIFNGHSVVYLHTSNLRYLVYHCNVCARRKKIEVYVIE